MGINRLIIFVCLMFSSCNNHNLAILPTPDCEASYAIAERGFGINDTLHGKLRVIWFSDKENEIDSTLIHCGLDLLNSHIAEVKLHMSMDTMIEIISYKKHNMINFISHAQEYNRSGVFTMYVYGNEQHDFEGEDYRIKGAAAGIPSRAFCLQSQFLNSSTISHEFLHCVGLFHIHEPDQTDGFNNETGDRVCDTPSYITSDDILSENCDYIGHQIPDTSNITCNLMSYAYPYCRNCLTQSQKARVRYIIHESSNLKACFGIRSLNL